MGRAHRRLRKAALVGCEATCRLQDARPPSTAADSVVELRACVLHVAGAGGAESAESAAACFDRLLASAVFRIGRDWLLPAPSVTDAARRALVIEADSSVGEQALALGAESANDLTLQEASQGCAQQPPAEHGWFRLGVVSAEALPVYLTAATFLWLC